MLAKVLRALFRGVLQRCKPFIYAIGNFVQYGRIISIDDSFDLIVQVANLFHYRTQVYSSSTLSLPKLHILSLSTLIFVFKYNAQYLPWMVVVYAHKPAGSMGLCALQDSHVCISETYVNRIMDEVTQRTA